MVRSLGRLTKGVVIDLPVAVVAAVFGRGSRRRRVVLLQKELAQERTKLREHQVRVATLEAELAALQEQPKEPRVAKRGKPTPVVAERETAEDTLAQTEVEVVTVVVEAEAEAGLQAALEVAEAEVLEEIEVLVEEAEVLEEIGALAEEAEVLEEIEALVEEAEVLEEIEALVEEAEMLEEIEALVEEAEILEEIEALVEEAEILEEIEALVEESALEEIAVEVDWVAVIEEGAGELSRAEPGRRDDLTRLQGIGAKSAARLYDAGIVTFAQLAEMDEESLAALIQAPDWRRPDYAQWISQARLAAAEAPAVPADDLSQLEGIGPTYAQRLRAAGIASFSQLAEADPERLAEVCQAPEFAVPDYASWIAQARGLMGMV